MLFKNYVNRISNSNRIYTKPEIREMKLKDFFKKKKELLSQYDDIGLPKLDDLKSSPNVNYVEDPNEVFGGRWESVGVGVNKGVNDDGSLAQLQGVNGAGVNKGVNGGQGSFAQSQGLGVNTGTNSLDGMTGAAAPVMKGGVEMNVTPEMQKFYEDTQRQVKYAPNSYITAGGPEVIVQESSISSRKPSLPEKYDGLGPLERLQKLAAKFPLGTSSEKQYYGHSLHLADGEAPTKFMKEQNDFYKISDIEDVALRQIYLEKAAKMYNYDLSSPDLYEKLKDVDIVMPKKDSQLYSQIKNSEAFQKWVAENYEQIVKQQGIKESMEFPKLKAKNDRALFATIHRTDMKNANINQDGSFSVLLSDAFDFEKMKHEKGEKLKDAILKTINNTANSQQASRQLKNYLLSTQVTLTKEEVEKILNKYKK